MIKKCIITSLVFFAGSVANAQAWLKYNLQSQVQMHWLRHESFEHSWDCYPFGKGDVSKDEGGESPSATFSSQHMQPGTRTLITFTSTYFRIPIRETRLVFSSSEKGNVDNVDLQVTDNVTHAPRQDWGSSHCVTRVFVGGIQSYTLAGNIGIFYKVPKNAWLLKISPKVQSGVVSADLIKTVKGTIEPTSIFLDQPFYVWVRPGTVIELRTHFAGTPGVSGNLGEVQFAIEAVGKNLTSLSQAKLAVAQINRLSNKILLSSASPKVENTFISKAMSLVRSKPKLHLLIESLGTSQFEGTINNIFNVANFHYLNGPAAIEVKAAAAILAYQMSLTFLKEMSGFCTTVPVRLPFLNTKQNYQGFVLAYLWLHRTEARLKDYSYADVSEVLRQLTRYENDRMTYAAIMRNQTEAERMKRLYNKIMNYGDLADDPYADFAKDVRRTIHTFGSISMTKVTTLQLESRLLRLGHQHDRLMSQIVDILRQFNRSNNSRVVASPLIGELNQLQQERKNLVNFVQNQVKFLAVGMSQNGSNGFIDSISSLLDNELAIFDKPLSTHFIEPIRKSYRKYNNIDSLHKTYNQCLFGG